VIVRHSRGDVFLFKSTGDAHDRAIGGNCFLRREREEFSY
jgi:hypothetical protein